MSRNFLRNLAEVVDIQPRAVYGSYRISHVTGEPDSPAEASPHGPQVLFNLPESRFQFIPNRCLHKPPDKLKFLQQESRTSYPTSRFFREVQPILSTLVKKK